VACEKSRLLEFWRSHIGAGETRENGHERTALASADGLSAPDKRAKGERAAEKKVPHESVAPVRTSRAIDFVSVYLGDSGTRTYPSQR
jgi:hypothetical protein